MVHRLISPVFCAAVCLAGVRGYRTIVSLECHRDNNVVPRWDSRVAGLGAVVPEGESVSVCVRAQSLIVSRRCLRDGGGRKGSGVLSAAASDAGGRRWRENLHVGSSPSSSVVKMLVEDAGSRKGGASVR